MNPVYEELYPDRITGALKMYSRLGSFPLDSSSVFNTHLELIDYVNAPGSYAYGGQLVAVANGTVGEPNGAKDYSFYAIRSDKSIQTLSDTLVFDTVELAEAYVLASQPQPGKIFTVKSPTSQTSLELYLVNIDLSLTRVSFNSTDIPDMNWNSIVGKPTSTPSEIDSAVTAAAHANRETLDKLTDVDSALAYQGKVLATKDDCDNSKITTVAPIDPVKDQVYFDLLVN